MFAPVALIGIAMMSCVMSVAVLGSLLQAGIPGVRRWCAAYALLTTTLTLLILGSGTQADIVVIGASALLVGAALLVLQGFRQFFWLRPSFRREYAVLAAILIGLVYWTYVSPDVDARASVISAFLAYVRLVIGWMAQRYRSPGRPKYCYRFVTVAAVLGAVVHAVRGVVYGFGLAHQTAFLEATPLNIAFLGMGILTLPCLSIGMVMLAHDRLAERMERLATIDDLTGVLVRRAFMAQAGALLDVARATNSKLSIAILDIDNFKDINDTYGHAAGDQALAHVASAISQRIRKSDIVGRLGGEEFAVLFPLMGKDEAARITNQLRATVAVSFSHAPASDVVCTFSAGVDEFGDGDTLATVMARADAALYAAKAQGRDCVVLAPSPKDPVTTAKLTRVVASANASPKRAEMGATEVQ
jgi:diguanylate cyclase (GGDEF)-like protein